MSHPPLRRVAYTLAGLAFVTPGIAPSARAGGEPCISEQACPDGEDCQDFVCQPAPPCEDCGPPHLDCTTAADCPSYQDCIFGTCQNEPLPICGDVFPCPDGSYCAAGQCLPGSPPAECDGRTPCPTGEYCVEGHCVAEPECRSHTECRGGLCEKGVCVTRFYDPPGLTPLDLPDPPGELGPEDAPPIWLIPDDDDPFGDIPPLAPPECASDAKGKILCCSHVTGWSFEKDEVDEDGKSLYQAWAGAGVFGRGPVYGNNVHIDRIMPPGYTNAALYGPGNNVGGDYWAFSRDVNQQGKWWIGSTDVRPSPEQLPNGRVPEGNTGTLVSPRFFVDSAFIRFFVGGTATPSQRVQLEIHEPDAARRAQLAQLYEGVGVTELPGAAGGLPIQAADPNWVVVRASSPKDKQEFMHRRVAWNVTDFKGKIARVVVVDSDKWGWHPTGWAHINIDEVICTDELDDEVTWDQHPKTGLPSKVGEAETPIPIWGTTDTHTHPFVNLAFGDYLVWGDPRDELKDVYSCHGELPEIKEGAETLRPHVTQVSPEPCSASPFAVLTVASLPCGVFFGIPFVGLVLGPVCEEAVVDVTNILVNQPLVEVHSLHGSPSALSGGISIKGAQDVFDELTPFMNTFDDVMTEIAIGWNDIAAGMPEHVHGLVEILGWDMDDGGHSQHGIKGHQIVQKDMIRRAYQGGLRMMGIDVIESRSITGTLHVGQRYDEWATIRDTTHAVRDLVSCGQDPKFPTVGPLCDIAGIALSPADIRELVKRNKLAVVLGTETDELGIERDEITMALYGHPAGTEDSIELQIQDLWDLGIRKVTAIHALNNPLGGAGIFNDTYLTGNNDLANKMDPTAIEASSVTIPWFVAGNFEHDMFAIKHLETYDIIGAQWFTDHAGYVALDPVIGDDWIGGDVTFEYGYPSVATPLGLAAEVGTFGDTTDLFKPPAFGHGGTWGGVNEVQHLKNVDQLLSGGAMCNVDGVGLPLPVKSGWVPFPVKEEHNQAFGKGMANAVGLHDMGKTALHELMKRGMIIDLDHFSQEARVDADAVAQDLGDMVFNDGQRLYPFFGVHTNSREHERHGPFPDHDHLREAGGYTAETDRTLAEFEQQKNDGGVFSPGANAGFMPDSPDHEEQVRNDCDYSSKSFAHRYLWMLDVMDGRGLTPSTDMSPFFTPAAPRFGQYQCHTRTSYAYDMTGLSVLTDKDGNSLEYDFDCNVLDYPWTGPFPEMQCKTHNFPHDWVDAPDGDLCRIKGKDLPGCPTHDNLAQQYAEGAGVWYVDYDNNRDSATQPAQPPPPAGQPKVRFIDARRADEVRDDGAPRAKVTEVVAIGGARQMWAMKKMKTNAGWKLDQSKNTGWDVNIDGFPHIGLFPDFLQDVRNVGVSWERMTPLFNAVEEYTRMWERTCQLANTWADKDSTVPGCAPSTIADLK